MIHVSYAHAPLVARPRMALHAPDACTSVRLLFFLQLPPMPAAGRPPPSRASADAEYQMHVAYEVCLGLAGTL